MERNESIFSWKLRKFAQHGGYLFFREVLTIFASIATIVTAVVVVKGMIYAGPDSTTGEEISDKASKILQSVPLDDGIALTRETREILSEIAAHKSKDLTEETAIRLIKATKETAPPTDCHFPWRQNACVKNILENLQKRTSNK